MYIPSTDPDSIDDKDIMGVYVASIEHYIGFGRDDVKERFIGEWDAVSYEVRKFISLLSKCNPNVLGLLWLSDDHLIYEHPLGARLRAEDAYFSSTLRPEPDIPRAEALCRQIISDYYGW